MNARRVRRHTTRQPGSGARIRRTRACFLDQRNEVEQVQVPVVVVPRLERLRLATSTVAWTDASDTCAVLLARCVVLTSRASDLGPRGADVLVVALALRTLARAVTDMLGEVAELPAADVVDAVSRAASAVQRWTSCVLGEYEAKVDAIDGDPWEVASSSFVEYARALSLADVRPAVANAIARATHGDIIHMAVVREAMSVVCALDGADGAMRISSRE